MFMFWTIITIWILAVSDQALLQQRLDPTSTQALLPLQPTSLSGWLLVASWIIPLVLVVLRRLSTSSFVLARYPTILTAIFSTISRVTLPIAFFGAVGNMKWLDWSLIILTITFAIISIAIGAEGLLLLSTVAATGLSLHKIEQRYS